MKRIVIIFVLISLLILGSFLYCYNRVHNSHGSNLGKIVFQVEKGEGLSSVAKRLDAEKIISGSVYLYYYMQANDLLTKLLPGEYELSGSLTIPEISTILTQEKITSVKITFPEGWIAKQMAERLTENDLDGEGFLKLVNNPAEFQEEFSFLQDKKIKSLEGFLFPDTYFFAKEIEARGIIEKMLRNFENKLTAETQQKIESQGKSLLEVITMASLIEKEVVNAEDREIVSGIFWGRMKIGQALQSCATLAYILGVNKKQYSYTDTQIVSPYNTYQVQGLPPGPIANPGIAAIFAAVNPTESNYNYFLSDPSTGKTVFSATLDEHNANKVKYGL